MAVYAVAVITKQQLRCSNIQKGFEILTEDSRELISIFKKIKFEAVHLIGTKSSR